MRRVGGLLKALGIAAIVVLFLISTLLFSPSFHEQPIFNQVASFVGLFFNFYLMAASAVVLGWFVYQYFIWPRLRYNQLLRRRAALGRGSKNVEQI